MRRIWIWGLLLALAVLALPQLAGAGGWAVLTLAEWPEQVIAGEPVTLRFTLRQHGQEVVTDITGTITAVHAGTGQRVSVPVAPDGTGYLEAALTLPSAGEWRWSVDVFDVYTMPPLLVGPAEAAAQPPATLPANASAVATEPAATRLPVLALASGGLGLLVLATALAAWARIERRWALGLAIAGLALSAAALAAQLSAPSTVAATAPPPLGETIALAADSALAERGAILFQVKGCVSCHRHAAFPDAHSVDAGPELSRYAPDPAFVRRWLADPAAVRPGTFMPNLDLDEAEIEALLAFLAGGQERTAVSGATAGQP